jgi:hypothetical protein
VFEQDHVGRKRALAGRADAIAHRHLAVSPAGIETLSQATPLVLAYPPAGAGTARVAPESEDEDDLPEGVTNPYHSALQALAAKHREKKENSKMSQDQAIVHLAEHSDLGRKLMVHAKEFDLRRAAKLAKCVV